MHPELILNNYFGQQMVVKAYDFFMGLAALAVLSLSVYYVKKLRLPLGRCLIALAVMAAAVPLGARALHILINPSYYVQYPERALAFSISGFSLMGGLLLAALAGSVAIRLLKIPFLPLADAVAPGLGIGLALMRIGCFLNGCCFGWPSRLPWAVHFPYGSLAHKYYVAMNAQAGKGLTLGQLFGSPAVHPTQLYEMLAAVLAALLAIVLIKKGVRSGLPFFSAALVFTCARLGNHFLRVPAITIQAPPWFFPLIYSGLILGFIATLIILARWDGTRILITSRLSRQKDGSVACKKAGD